MGRRNKPPLPARVETLRRRLEAWRKRKKSTREPISDSIWRSAAALAQTHGVNRIAVELGLNYDALKVRAENVERKIYFPKVNSRLSAAQACSFLGYLLRHNGSNRAAITGLA